MWRWISLEGLGQDLRYGERMLRKNPVFTAVAVGCLALGIGANTAIFSIIDTLMLKALPVSRPRELVELQIVSGPGERFNAFSWQTYQLLRDNNTAFEGLIACPTDRFHAIPEGGEPERVEGQYVTGNYFPVLGVNPVIGRLIGPDDDRLGSPNPVAVISYGYWQRRFALDSNVLGKRITVESVPLTVVGVTPPSFFGVQVGRMEDISIPLAMEPVIRSESQIRSAGSKWLRVLGRLKPGVSLSEAHAQLSVLFHRTLAEEARIADTAFRERILNWKLDVVPAAAGLSRLRDQFSKPLLILMGIAGFVLLIACANVAMLLLARAASRQREFAVRVSLGAGRLRLIRQLLTESLLLAGAGAALGVVLAWLAGDALIALMSSGRMPFTLEVRPDMRVLLFTAGIGIATVVLFGLTPAIRAAHSGPGVSLRFGGRGSSDRGLRGLLGKALVAFQVGLSVLLLTGAGLFIRSLRNIQTIDLGFDRNQVLLVRLDPSATKLTAAQKTRLYRSLLQRIREIPGIRAASLCWIPPITGGGAMLDVSVQGYTPKPNEPRSVYLNWVAPSYFETLGTHFIAGRDFRTEDVEHSPKVAIINRAMARYYFGSGNPIGSHVVIDGRSETIEIIGVVGDAKYLEIRETAPRTMYLNPFQDHHPASDFAIRTIGHPANVAGDVRRVVRDAAADIPISRVTTLSRHIDASIIQERLLAALSSVFGSLGLILAAIGLHGLLAYAVARRTNETGIRMALGATRKRVISMVLKEALLLVSVGLGGGLVLALALSRLVASQLYGVSANDPIIIAAGAFTLLVMALIASYLPARRAARVDPMGALRYE